MSRSAVYEALETLAAWNLITGWAGRWTLNTATNLAQLAEQFGCLDDIRAQVQRHRWERAAYRLAFRVVDRHDRVVDAITAPDEPFEWLPEPPRRNRICSICSSGSWAPTPSPAQPGDHGRATTHRPLA